MNKDKQVDNLEVNDVLVWLDSILKPRTTEVEAIYLCPRNQKGRGIGLNCIDDFFLPYCRRLTVTER